MMKRKIRNLIIPLLCLLAANLYGQTWQIGYPTASSVTATYSNGTLTISGTGAMQDWSTSPWNNVKNSIQKVIINNGVTKIGNRAFENCSNLTSVTIGNSVQTIGLYAFSWCQKLSSVTFGNAVTTIGGWAFDRCYDLKSVSIPNSVQTIGEAAFSSSGLSSLTIPNAVKIITKGAFSNCFRLTTVLIGNSVTSIGSDAFSNCDYLSSVTIPNSVTSIGETAFRECKRLKDVTVNWSTPLSIPSNTFRNVDVANVRLHVPAGTEKLYAAASVWRNFSIGLLSVGLSVDAITTNSTSISSLSQSFTITVKELRNRTTTNVAKRVGFALYNSTGSTEIGYAPARINFDALQPGWGWTDYPTKVRLSDFSLTTLPARGTYRIYPVASDNLSSPYRPFSVIKGTDNSDKYVTITILSDNADLSSLSVNSYSLSPSFSANTTRYTVTVPNSVTSRTISATAADSRASVTGTGSKSLNVGDNSFNVVVKAEAGNTKTYTIIIKRESDGDMLTVSPTTYNFGSGGGTSSTISVTSNRSWTVSSNASWLTTSRTSGSNNNTFTMSATANTSSSSRSATVTVSGGGISRTISVTQNNAELTVSPTSYNFSASGGSSSTISVTSNQSWTVSSNASWLTTSRASGSNNNTFTMTAPANTSTAMRTATVSVTGGGITRTISVTQDVPLIVSPATYNFPASGGASSTISVTSNQTWTVSSNAAWLTTSRSSGSNNNTFTMTATANTSSSSRNATVTVAGGGITKTLNVTQDGTTQLTVSPQSYNFSANGGASSTITVTSNQSWTVSSNAAWLTTSRSSGSNNNTFTMTATANTSSSSRNATVTVTGGGISKTVNVTQAGTGNSSCSVAPLLKTKWDQSAPYNNEIVSKIGNYPTGCVATAMAQIMNYWQHPTQRTVSIPKYTTDELRISIPAITGTTTYDWNNMRNTTSEYTSATQRNAVAKLMYECGVAVKMDYTREGSGAYNTHALAALPSYFGYDNTIRIENRKNHNDNNWENLLRTELDAGRPIYYTGDDPSPSGGGHAFVCDGYNCDGKFYFNWGWGGTGDGYFVTSALKVSGYTFNKYQEIIINIKPNQKNFLYPTEPDGANTFVIYANEGAGGSLIPSEFTIVHRGANQPYTFEPHSGYEIDQVLINGIPDDNAKENGYYTFWNVTANQTIFVTFKASATGNDHIHAQNITIYPNPAKDEIFIKSDSQIKKIEIFSLTGTLVITENNINEKISVSALPRGIYLLKAHTDTGLAVGKIIKE